MWVGWWGGEEADHRPCEDPFPPSCPDASETKSLTSSSMATLLETLNKRKPEPDTVYLDLRGFEQHRKEEQERMASVSRVLGLQQER